MSNHESGPQCFEIDDDSALAALSERYPDERGVDDLLFVEEARLNGVRAITRPTGSSHLWRWSRTGPWKQSCAARQAPAGWPR